MTTGPALMEGVERKNVVVVREQDVGHSSHWGGSPQDGLVEQSWLQLMCYAICLSHGRNFR